MSGQVTDRVSVESGGVEVEKVVQRRPAPVDGEDRDDPVLPGAPSAITDVVRLELSTDGEDPVAVRIADLVGEVDRGELYLHPDTDAHEDAFDGERLWFEMLVPADGQATAVYGVSGAVDGERASGPDVEAVAVLDAALPDEVPDGARLFPTTLTGIPRPDRERTDRVSAQVTKALARSSGTDAVDGPGEARADGDRASGTLLPDGDAAGTSDPDDPEPPGDEGSGEDPQTVDRSGGEPPAGDRSGDEGDTFDTWIEPAEAGSGDDGRSRSGVSPGDDPPSGDTPRPGTPRTEPDAEWSATGDDVDHTGSRIATVEADLADLRSSHETVIEDLRSEVDALRERQEEEYEAIRTAIEEVSASVDDLTAVAGNLREDLDWVEQTLEETRTELRDLEDTHESEVSELASDLESNRRALRTLRDEVEALSDVRTKLKEFLQRESSSLGELERRRR